MPHVRKIAERLIPPNSPPISIMLMKKIMHNYFKDILAKTLDLENIGNEAAFKTHDFRESTKSLQEKRDPVFTGKSNKAVRDLLDKF